MKKITNSILTIFVSLFTLCGLNVVALPVTVAALSPNAQYVADSQADACAGLNQLGGTSCQAPGSKAAGAGQNRLASLAKTVVNIISFVAGMAAVIMIVIAGIRFITSGGDSNAVSGARNMLMYALIGLVIVALAQVIVHFVLNAVINNVVTPNNPPPSH